MKDLSQALAFKIVPKDLVSQKKIHLIKNKFALTKEVKLWKTLIGFND